MFLRAFIIGTFLMASVIVSAMNPATKGMNFNGSTGFITCLNSSNFNFGSGDFTITAWFKVDTNCTNSDHTIAGKNIGSQAGGQYNGYRLAFYWGNKLMLTVNNGSLTYNVIGATVLTKGQWYHVAAMRNGRYLRIYLNGALYADSGELLPATGYSLDNSYPFAIGAAVYWGHGLFFNGNIDAVGVYNKALSRAEVSENMCFNALPSGSNLVAYYSFDQGFATDDSGNGNTGTLCGGVTSTSDGIRWTGSDEFEAVQSLLPNFSITPLPTSGNVNLANSLTVSDLANVVLDNTNLTVGSHTPYPTGMSDGLSTGTGPYVAANIQPFRLKYFVNEFNYGGWHNFEMFEYALVHGFNCLGTYNSGASDWSHLPPGTIFGGVSGLNYSDWMTARGIDIGRLDQLPSQASIFSDHLANNLFPFEDGHHVYMIDLEIPASPLDFSALQSQSWYVSGLENIYYDGFVNAELATIDAAHSQGWTNVGIYGWQPWARTWYFNTVNEATRQQRWDEYGKYIAAEVNLLYPSVYCLYWSEQNVAYVMQNLDMNIKYADKLPVPQRKPVRPYYWNQLHGGGGGWRWWRELPLTNEELRAMSTMNFFTGVQGLVLWGWSGLANQHIPDGDIVAGNTVTVKSDFTTGGGSFHRYDALYFLSADSTTVRFQRVLKNQSGLNYGVDANPSNGIYDDENYQYPVYTMAKSDIVQYLRPKSEPVSAMVEGLALVKLFEYTLSHGQPCIDVLAINQFNQLLPVVRRVQFGTYHIIATYDPCWAENTTPRTVTLNNFAGNAGLSVTVVADKQTRIYVVCK